MYCYIAFENAGTINWKFI